ncbi:Oidioi.mRNA.OKI2018_I69.PAR.g10498.t1.cds [Oikopleura dioica]|uniref:Oidioi.mRNA.OKI2018_I69.PAR.g10498.t1.cds n=1 Tax=Oikopleura dioica TaxID=34765 RepID=A0ABN7RYH9_OIKDI|nr:Oidioi.mRNA.OKI2018_I69.PAR.g10498.t1.cds [Oikopleura dioica]
MQGCFTLSFWVYSERLYSLHLQFIFFAKKNFLTIPHGYALIKISIFCECLSSCFFTSLISGSIFIWQYNCLGQEISFGVHRQS